MNLRLYMRDKLMFVVAFSLFFCSVFVFAADVYANGNTTADAPDPAAPAVNRSVRRAPVKRPPPKAPAKTATRRPAASTQRAQPKPKQPTSLETGIQLMEQMRYKQACLVLQKAVKEEPNNPYAWYWYGMAHDKVGQFQQAQFFYAKALALSSVFQFPKKTAGVG